MFPRSVREMLMITFWLSWPLMLLSYLNGWAHYAPWAVTGFAIGCVGSTLGLAALWAHGDTGPVDIWEPQRKLMKASDQSLPLSPTLTNDSVLYLFLTMEELSEYAGNLYGVLEARWGTNPNTQERGDLLDHLSLLSRGAKQYADMGRNFLATTERLAYRLDLREAVALLDDATDVTVTASGISLSTGLSGRLGYREVATSNLSKRNPDTLKIDKHPDGKWIKGRNFRRPNLEQYLVGHYMR